MIMPPVTAMTGGERRQNLLNCPCIVPVMLMIVMLVVVAFHSLSFLLPL